MNQNLDKPFTEAEARYLTVLSTNAAIALKNIGKVRPDETLNRVINVTHGVARIGTRSRKRSRYASRGEKFITDKVKTRPAY